MATFVQGATIALTFDYDDMVTWDGGGVATITSATGVTSSTLTGRQYLGPYRQATTISIVTTSAGSYTQASNTSIDQIARISPDGSSVLDGVGNVVGGGGIARAPYLGFVATRMRIPDSLVVTGPAANATRQFFYARDQITVPQFEFPNLYAGTANGESGSGGVLTIRASVEYPLGSTPVPITFAGSQIGTIANGGSNPTYILSDPTTLATKIPWGAKFAVRTVVGYTATGLPWKTSYLSMIGEGFMTSVNVNNEVYGNGTITQATDKMYGPSAIVQMTTRPSALLLGDSICEIGVGNATDQTTGDYGCFARSVGPAMAYANVGIGGDSLVKFQLGDLYRIHLGTYVTDILCNYGVNDMKSGGRTAVQVQNDMITVAALFPGKRFWPSTITPVSSGTFTTVSGQTADANVAVIDEYNNRLRAGLVTGMAGYIDLRRALQSLVDGTGAAKQDSSLWQILNSATPQANITNDGLHPNLLGDLMIAASNAVPIARMM
jgi:hypothetical protein